MRTCCIVGLLVNGRQKVARSHTVEVPRSRNAITERLVRQGFWCNKLCITFKKFARRYNVLISKYGVSVRAHVTEGICIPLVAKPDLIRNVTLRGCGRGRST